MDYILRYVNLPCTVKAMTVKDVDGFNNIYINSNLCYEQQQEAIGHELTHILRGDFDKEETSLEEVETM